MIKIDILLLLHSTPTKQIPADDEDDDDCGGGGGGGGGIL